VLFDPATVADVATFENPTQPARGISHVLVNGNIAYANGAVSEHGAGMVVERN
jgi:N-acyl-D-amino-acid deacylase